MTNIVEPEKFKDMSFHILNEAFEAVLKEKVRIKNMVTSKAEQFNKEVDDFLVQKTKVSKYLTVLSDCSEDFDERVNELIGDGWQVHGTPTISISEGTEHFAGSCSFAQVMVKYES